MTNHDHQHHHNEHDHDHGLGGSHHHGSGRVLLISLCFTLAFAVVELIAGWFSGSLALWSDAGHMITDTSSLGVGAFAAWLAQRPASSTHSFGLLRSEVLGAALNTLFMLAIVVAIAVSAVARFLDPAPVDGPVVLAIGALGFCVNLGVGAILMRGERTMNVRGALLHVFGDLLGSVAAVVAGGVILATGWMPIDPLLSLVVCVLILISALRLLRDVVRVLMEGVPRDLDANSVGSALTSVDGVRSIHDLHIWNLSSTTRAIVAHIEVSRLSDWETIRPRLERLLAKRFSITHTTLQPEDRITARACRDGHQCGVTAAE
ncbi:cation diffusion facilitator family transporter [Salinisphaera orenii]|uniref:cation diffusion facilitator family transporter n=1 Tax=Salinisphaera orenii TaxID=856731 RepID=UPI001E4E34FA